MWRSVKFAVTISICRLAESSRRNRHVFGVLSVRFISLLPMYAHCGCRIIGHGIEAKSFLLRQCARQVGRRYQIFSIWGQGKERRRIPKLKNRKNEFVRRQKKKGKAKGIIRAFLLFSWQILQRRRLIIRQKRRQTPLIFKFNCSRSLVPKVFIRIIAG